jgi:hypothetical protein
MDIPVIPVASTAVRIRVTDQGQYLAVIPWTWTDDYGSPLAGVVDAIRDALRIRDVRCPCLTVYDSADSRVFDLTFG